MKIGHKETAAEFLVITGKGTPLLTIGPVLSAISTVVENLQQQYPEVFKDIGKLNTEQVDLHIDPNIKPVAQPLRSTPLNLRSKVEKNINKMLYWSDYELVG